jgi:SET domain-containing protein
MIVPRTSVRPSSISGLGLFAEEPIPAGSVVWMHHDAVDIRLDEGKWTDLPDHVRNRLLRHSWVCRQTGIRWGSLDDDHRMNHSDDPNTECIGAIVVASRDILPGDEITADYREFHDGDIWEGNEP